MKEKKKNTKILLPILLVALLIAMVGGVTYAFFNYTRTGVANTFSVGRISFNTRQTETINLSNLFPIDVTGGIPNDNTKVGTFELEITGDTDYVGGIEYLVSAVNTHVTTSTGQIVPISLDVTVEGLGTQNKNYFTARESKDTTIYKRLSGNGIMGDQQLLVGYIPQNTTLGTPGGINGKITIKAYLDASKIAITDTYDGNETDLMGTTNEWVNGRVTLTTEDWNAFQNSGISFQVKVEANEDIWVEETLYDIIERQTVMDNINSTYVNNTTPGIDFSQISSDTNGKGVYTFSSTANDAYPVMYYRGDVNNNNVLFANKCWKMVRTTDTGGVKLIYNGEPFEIYTETPIEESDYSNVANNSSNSFTFSNNMWSTTITNRNATEISFTVPEGSGYKVIVSGTSGTSARGNISIYKGENIVKSASSAGYGAGMDLSYVFGNLTSTDVIKVKLDNIYATTAQPITLNVQMIRQEGESLGTSCDNTGVDTVIQLNGQTGFAFNSSDNSSAYTGYMYGTVYEVINGAPISGAYFGTGFTWDGAKYTLINAKVGADDTHHYTCNSTTADGTCVSIRYYVYIDSSYRLYFYITLTNGESVEDALRKMQVNTNDSNAKTTIDGWYASNLNAYTSKLEDTIWCSDRSISNLGGWNPNGGSLSDSIFYSGHTRASTTNEPSLSCINSNDAFTVNNSKGNQKLTYPVAMLTSDELILSGAKLYHAGTIYTNGGANAWVLSPYYISVTVIGIKANDVILKGSGSLDSDSVNNLSGLRPSISLKNGTAIIDNDADGTVSKPYIIKMD